ncbi:FMN-binding negative transcriptional regulator [Frigoribacterium sp. NBH87]|uniref:FMN-binding negative transcriptional regulator n=1 Tax=Frigoribacterium sp. NBH87 TaxID=2596916 RepID=UPI00162ACB05|nr:FMN-binding negative transcriptional regulator [Frigoribacterium sp. NBH87]QNE43132.1 FMN-binding negative transcriptional regulator [Frigoribacterium sp. NBH87]
MRHTPHCVLSDVAEVARLVRENPWATIVAHTAEGLVASHYPVVLEETDDGSLSLVSHVGRPDERSLELGQGEVMIIIQGPHGYVSPGWYPAEQIIPTWNHVTAHLWATPEILSDDENFRVLGELVDHFERVMPEPSSLQLDEEGARRVARGTVGVRLRVTRFDARLKLSQNKPPEVVDRIVAELEHGEHYAQPALAAEMRRVHPR